MAYNYSQNVAYSGTEPNFERDRVATLSSMLTHDVSLRAYDYGHIVFCKEDGNHYRFMYDYDNPPSDSEKDSVTGWFVLLKSDTSAIEQALAAETARAQAAEAGITATLNEEVDMIYEDTQLIRDELLACINEEETRAQTAEEANSRAISALETLINESPDILSVLEDVAAWIEGDATGSADVISQVEQAVRMQSLVISRLTTDRIYVTSDDLSGLFVSNFNTGVLSKATDTQNSLILKVNAGDAIYIHCDGFLYAINNSIQFYGGEPSADTNIRYAKTADWISGTAGNGVLQVPDGCKYIVITVATTFATFTLRPQVTTDLLCSSCVTGSNIALATVGYSNLADALFLCRDSGYIKEAETACKIISRVYLKQKPADIGDDGKIYLWQILYKHDTLGTRFVFHYDDASAARQLIVIPAESDGFFCENEFFKIEYSFLPVVNGFDDTQIMYAPAGQVELNPARYMLDFLPVDRQASTDDVAALSGRIDSLSATLDAADVDGLSARIERLSDSVSSVIWPMDVQHPTGTANLVATLERMFVVSSAADLIAGVYGTLIERASYDWSGAPSGPYGVTKFIAVQPETQYTINRTIAVAQYDVDFALVKAEQTSSAWASATFTTEAATAYVRYITSYKSSTLMGTKFVEGTDTSVVSVAPVETGGVMDGALLGDGSIALDKLDADLQAIITAADADSTPVDDLSRYTMYSIGDSMSAANQWQAATAALTGINWSAEANTAAGNPLSMGGTRTHDTTFESGLFRTWNLIKSGYIEGDGEGSVVVFQNVNDGALSFDSGATVFTPAQILEGYSYNDFGAELLESIPDDSRLFGTVLRLEKSGCYGKNLAISALPAKAGNVTLTIHWAAPGTRNYVLTVSPDDTQETLLGKILEYSFDRVTDVLSADGMSVDFSWGATTEDDNSRYPLTVTFSDTDATGMAVTITDTSSASMGVPKYFVGTSLDGWTDTGNWVDSLPWSGTYIACIEMVQRAYPKAHIFVTAFPRHNTKPASYMRADGTYDTLAWRTNEAYEAQNEKRIAGLQSLCDFCGVTFVNVDRECGITLSNYSTYYPDGNVHPKAAGYTRIGEVVASNLKRYLP